MEAKLVRVEPTREGETGDPIPLGEIVTIGRSPGNNLVLPDDQISRNHALIRREGEDYLIMDLGSANGTFVNDKPVTSATPLRTKDVIRIGESEFVFQDEEREFPSTKEVRKGTQRVFANVNLAVLVSDVRNYTVLSSALPADGLSMVLADWFRRVGECIEARAGNIEKFRGDSVMAYWISKPGGGDNAHILGALRAARDMVEASHEYDESLAAQYPGHAFRIGCGIHCGDAVLGNIGADSRRDFTTLGDCVNVTFRIESLCSTLDRPVLVSEEIKAQAQPEFEFDDMGPQSLKGKEEPITIYALRMTNT
jgi:adenylate cyclase